MSQYIVSARKYRPHTFEEVVGQEHITGTLENAIKNDQLAQSFLFCGPRGVGKTTCARILAREINKDAAQPNLLGETDVNMSMNIFELDAASNNSVDDIRNLIDQVRFPPQTGKYKVYIIDEVHMLSQAAFNAFLKTLEEPPAYAIFVLATTEKHKIIPTILSRCQIFDFRRITPEDMVGHLRKICEEEGIEAEDNALQIIATKSDGALRDALSLFDRLMSSTDGKKLTYEDVLKNLNILDYDYFFKVTDALLTEDLPKTMTIYNEIMRKGFEGDDFMLGLGEHFRNLLVCKDERTLDLLDLTGDLRQRYQQQALDSSQGFLLNGMRFANDCDLQYKQHKNKRLLVELSLAKICFATSAVKAATSAEAEPKKKRLAEPEAEAPKSAEPEEEANITSSEPEAEQPVPSSQSEEQKPSEEENSHTEKAEEQKPEVESESQEPEAKVININRTLDSTKAKRFEDALQEQISRPEEEKPEEEEDESEIKESSVILEELPPIDKVREFWDEYVKGLRDDSKDFATAQIMEDVKLVIDGNKLIAMTQSNMQIDMLQKDRRQLERFLYKSLGGRPDLIYQVDPASQKENKKPFTAKERLDKLIENNPKIKDLKDQLGLDLEH